MDYTFVDVMDFFFKAHKIFNLPHNPKIKSFMHFFECYIFKHINAKRLVPQKYESMGRELNDAVESSNNQNEAAKNDGGGSVAA